MVLAAKAFEMASHRQPAGRRVLVVERYGVIDVGTGRRAAAAWKSARQIAAPDGTLERGRGLIMQRCRGAALRIGQPERCCRGQLADLLGIDDPVALQITGQVALAFDGLLAGYHGDDHLRPGRIAIRLSDVNSVGALWLSAGTR